MNVREKFELSEGVTILACSGCDPTFDVIGKTLSLIRGDEIRQTLTLSGENKMLNQKSNLAQKAFETKDMILLSQEEAQSGEWQLIGNQLLARSAAGILLFQIIMVKCSQKAPAAKWKIDFMADEIVGMFGCQVEKASIKSQE